MINPYLDQTIADQFQAEADLSEFDPLDIAVLGNVASKKKNDIGINKLKQDAAFGLTPMQSVFKLYEEKRQAEEELAQRQAETQQLANVYASTSNDMEAPMGYGGLNDAFNPPRPTPPAGWNPYKGAIVDNWGSGASPESIAFPNGAADQVAPNPYLSRPTYKANLDMTGMPGSKTVSPVTVPIMETMEPVMPGSTPPAPAGPYTPGSYTAGLNTQLGSEMEGLYGMKREYAPDAAYNQAMAAVREALGKAPNVPTMAKPQLTQEDQALVALAGIFGGFQNMPQALQGALAGAQQRAEIQNQQLQNKYQQEQTAYGRQLQALQNIAQTEEERRKQAQEALDRQYEQAYRARLGGIEKLKANLANAPLKEQELALKQEGMGLKKEGLELQKTKEATKAATLRNQITKKEQVDTLNREIKSYNEKLAFLANREKITEKDVKDMLNFRIRAIQRLAQQGLSVPQDYFFIPPSGMNPKQVMAQANKVFNEGVDLAIDAATGKFPVIPLDPEIDKKFKTYQSEVDKMTKQNLEITRKNAERDIRLRKLQSEASRLQTPGGTTFMGTYKQPSVKQEDKKRFDDLMKEIENTRKAKAESDIKYKENLKYIKEYENEMNKMAGLEPVLPPADQGMKGAVSKTPGNKTSQNTVKNSLGTFTYDA